jgi:serine/threonine protein kinase
VKSAPRFSGIAGALSRVHAPENAHRDIKPNNLYWHDGRWCLGDFGLAEFDDAESITRSDRKLGPAYYIAPEMLNNASSADGCAADVYSLGKTICVMATGQKYPLPPWVYMIRLIRVRKSDLSATIGAATCSMSWCAG